MKKVVDDLKTTSKNSMVYANENSMVQAFKDWLFEESKKADSKAFHFGEQFNLGYEAVMYLQDLIDEKFGNRRHHR